MIPCIHPNSPSKSCVQPPESIRNGTASSRTAWIETYHDCNGGAFEILRREETKTRRKLTEEITGTAGGLRPVVALVVVLHLYPTQLFSTCIPTEHCYIIEDVVHSCIHLSSQLYFKMNTNASRFTSQFAPYVGVAIPSLHL